MPAGAYPTTIPEQLRALHAALHLSHTPQSMPCRAAQQATIREFVRGRVEARQGGSMYISGAPGTGKTASVDYVLFQLYHQRMLGAASLQTSAAPSSTTSSPSRKTVATSLLARFSAVAKTTPASASSNSAASSSSSTAPADAPRVVYLNAMAFSRNPKGLYPSLLAQVRGDDAAADAELSPFEAMEELKRLFCPDVPVNSNGSPTKRSASTGNAANSRMTIVVVDEVDALLSGTSPGVLYSLLEWPLVPRSRLVVLAISNSINLLETKLKHLAMKNAVPVSLVFATYSKEELKQIVLERCESIYPPIEDKSATKSQEVDLIVVTKATSLASPAKQSSAATPSKKRKAAPEDEEKLPADTSEAADTSGESTSAPAARRRQPIRGRACISASASPTKSPEPASPSTRVSRSAAKKLPSISMPSIAELDEQIASAKKSVSKRKPTAIEPVAEESNVTDTTTEPIQPGADIPDSSVDLLTTPKKKPKLAAPDASPSTPSTPLLGGAGHFDQSTLAPLSTRECPFFDPFALDLLCAKVAKGSGDLRKVLEVARKAVDALQVEWESRCILQRQRSTLLRRTSSLTSIASGDLEPTPTATPSPSSIATARAATSASMGERSTASPSVTTKAESEPVETVEPAATPLQVSFALINALTLQSLGSASDQGELLRSLPAQQKIVLIIAVLLYHLQQANTGPRGGPARDVLYGFAGTYAKFSRHFHLAPLRGHELEDLLAALAAHRLIKLTAPSTGAKKFGGSGASGAAGGSGSKRGGGSGSGAGGRGAPLTPKSTLGIGGALQVNVTLDALETAYAEDTAMMRLLAQGKTLAAALVAKAKLGTGPGPTQADYVMRDIEE